MRREWDLDSLIDSWTVLDADRELIANKYGPTLLGFVLILKFFEVEARFPRHVGEIPSAAVDFVARQVKVDPAELAGYDFTAGRSRSTVGTSVTTSGSGCSPARSRAEHGCRASRGSRR